MLRLSQLACSVRKRQAAATNTYFSFRNFQDGKYAVYFIETGLGSLFYPLRSNDAILYRDVDNAEFIRRVSSDYAFELTGMLWTNNYETTYVFVGCLGKTLTSRSPRLST